MQKKQDSFKKKKQVITEQINQPLAVWNKLIFMVSSIVFRGCLSVFLFLRFDYWFWRAWRALRSSFGDMALFRAVEEICLLVEGDLQM